jgi:hypothetical protein
MLKAIYGAAILATTIFLVMTLRPKGGKEKRLLQLPGMWIILGLILTVSIGAGVALLAMGIGIL